MIIAYFLHRPTAIRTTHHAATLRAAILNARAHANRGDSVRRARGTRRYRLAYDRAYRSAERQRRNQAVITSAAPPASGVPAPVNAMTVV